MNKAMNKAMKKATDRIMKIGITTPIIPPSRGCQAVLLAWAALALAVSPGPSSGVSLWTEESHSLYSNRKATRVGDVITVIIVENSSGYNRSTSNSKKEDKHDIEGSGVGPLDFIPLFGWDMTSKLEFKGNSSNTLGGGLSARISAQVIDILPNGHLLISGNRTLSVNGEKEMIAIFGEVRPEDVRANNTVLSTNVANAKISYEGAGPATQAVRRGIFTRLLGWLL